MSKELTPQQKFEEGIKARIRKDIGELLPDEILSNLCQKAVQDILDSEDNYSREKWLVKEVKANVGNKIRSIVDELLSNNQEQIKLAIADYLKENGTTLIAQLVINAISHNGIQNLQNYHFKLAEQLRINGLGIY